MVAFWAKVPPKPDQLCKLQIIASLEFAVVTVFAVTYLLHLWRHYREVQPDAEQYLAASWLPTPGHDYSRSAAPPQSHGCSLLQAGLFKLCRHACTSDPHCGELILVMQQHPVVSVWLRQHGSAVAAGVPQRGRECACMRTWW